MFVCERLLVSIFFPSAYGIPRSCKQGLYPWRSKLLPLAGRVMLVSLAYNFACGTEQSPAVVVFPLSDKSSYQKKCLLAAVVGGRWHALVRLCCVLRFLDMSTFAVGN